MAHSPLAHGRLTADTGSAELPEALAAPAIRLGVTPAQIAPAWVHHQNRPGQPVLPLPGATSVGHLRNNVEAASLVLTGAELRALSGAMLRPTGAQG